jgi:hypothetical protein
MSNSISLMQPLLLERFTSRKKKKFLKFNPNLSSAPNPSLLFALTLWVKIVSSQRNSVDSFLLSSRHSKITGNELK